MKINRILSIAAIIVSCIFASCEKHKDEPKVEEDITNVTLIYAVNHNNLASDFIYNRSQMLKAASSLNMGTDRVLIYSYEKGECTLKEMRISSAGIAEFVTVRNYEKNVLSTTPDRIAEVMDYIVKTYPTADKTLYLWGHGMGPVNPYKYSHLPADGSQKSPLRDSNDGLLYSFGGEYIDDFTGTMDYIDLDQLADAIPSGIFRTIWFDCCYMGSIETAYQLRDKCRFFVAYPTEIYETGLPYDMVLPLTAGTNPQLDKAAIELYNFYNSKSYAVTVSVIDLSKINKFADSLKDYVSRLDKKPVFTNVINYSRLSMPRPNSFIKHPYYDLIGWLGNGLDGSPALKDSFNELKKAYDEMMVYTAAGKQDFSHNEIDPDAYFGISVYPYYNDNSQRDNYYHKLDWWNDVACHYGWL